MPDLESMTSLTQEILRSYDDRTAAVKGLRTTVGSMRREMGNAHQSISKSLHASLAQDHAIREAATRGMLKGYDGTHQAMSRALHTDLARGQSQRKSQVMAQLVGLNSAHQSMSIAQRASLSHGAAVCRAEMGHRLANLEESRLTMARGLHSDLSQESANRKAFAKAMLVGYQRSRRASSLGLRADLARTKVARSSMARTMVREFQEDQARLRSQCAATQKEWMGLASLMQARRNGRGSKAVAPSMAVAAPTAARPTTAAEVAPETPEFAILRQHVFEYLANQPNGTRLVELEGEMSVSRFQMSRVLRSLMDEGKVEKRDLFYYAR